jgi:ATP-dependent DNA helicase RecG
MNSVQEYILRPITTDYDRKSSQKGSYEMSGKMSEKILRFIKENPAISTRELAALLEKSSRTIERKIAVLKAEGKLKRIGPAKGGHWEVVKKEGGRDE